MQIDRSIARAKSPAVNDTATAESTQSNQRSPLHDLHIELGGRIVPFAGWEMPVQYTGIMPEHLAVRKEAGIFDISHMGQVWVRGEGAGTWLDTMLTNRVADLEIGQGQYSFLLNEAGGVIDDLILYRSAEDEFFLVINASKIDEDIAWLEQHLREGLSLENHSDLYAGMAIQGPKSAELFAGWQDELEHALPPRNGIVLHNGNRVTCRTGYTGEDGFEFFCPKEEGAQWFKKAIEAGATPCGLGARDSLRLEMGYPLNGSDLHSDKTPLEAGLGFFVKLDKGEFIGRSVLAEQKEKGCELSLRGILATDPCPPLRPHYPILIDGEVVGELSSGVLSPSLGQGIGMAYLPSAQSKIGTEVEIEIRGRQFPAQVVKKPFYKSV